MNVLDMRDIGIDDRAAPLQPLPYSEGFLPGEPHLYYRIYGKAADGRVPLICLPGFWRNARDFQDLAVQIAPDRLVITPDMRGRGMSPRMPDVEDYHVDLLIGDVWRLLDHLGVRKAAFLGTTLGGWMSLMMAVEKPERVAGIVLNDVGVQASAHASKRMAGHAKDDEMTFEEAVARTRAQNEAHFSGLGEDDWVRLMLRAHRQTEAGTYIRDFDQLTNVETARFKADKPDFWTEYRGLGTVPVAILRGENSDYISEELMQGMASERTDTIVATVPGRGHPPLLDEPIAVDAVKALLRRADERVAAA